MRLKSYLGAIVVSTGLFGCSEMNTKDVLLSLNKKNCHYKDTLCTLLKEGDTSKMRAIVSQMPDVKNAENYVEGMYKLDSMHKSGTFTTFADDYKNKYLQAVYEHYQDVFLKDAQKYRAIEVIIGGEKLLLRYDPLLDEVEKLRKYDLPLNFDTPAKIHSFLDTFPYGIHSVIDQLGLKSMSGTEQLQKVKLLVQSIKYIGDNVANEKYMDIMEPTNKYNRIKFQNPNHGRSIGHYHLPPSFTVFSKSGDCDKTALLAYGILRELGHDVGVVRSESHLSVFVKVVDEYNVFKYKGKNYAHFETTNKRNAFEIDITPEEILAIYFSDGSVYTKPKGGDNKDDTSSVCGPCDRY